MLRTSVLLAAALVLCLAPSAAAWSLATLARAPPPTRAASSRLASHARMQEDATPAPTATIEFIEGVPEPVVPDVKLTRSRDGSTGVATFTFDNPSFLAVETTELGDTTGMFLCDDEGQLKTTDVTATFINGKPRTVKGVVVIKGEAEWDRFMRFMERYAESNGLGFSKA